MSASSDRMHAGAMRPLEGVSVVVTREHTGSLGRRLESLGADVVHVPLIATVDPDDGGAAVAGAISRLEPGAWLVVTSTNGARRVTAVRDRPDVRLAAVGTRTAAVLEEVAGRRPDVVPEHQTAADLAVALVAHPQVRAGAPSQFLLALADRAAPVLADRLIGAGHRVHSVVAYRTVEVQPATATWGAADALLLASGSAARAWAAAFGTTTPRIVVAIGPTTTDAAHGVGLKVSAQAADHSLDGLVDALLSCVAADRTRQDHRF